KGDGIVADEALVEPHGPPEVRVVEGPEVVLVGGVDETLLGGVELDGLVALAEDLVLDPLEVAPVVDGLLVEPLDGEVDEVGSPHVRGLPADGALVAAVLVDPGLGEALGGAVPVGDADALDVLRAVVGPRERGPRGLLPGALARGLRAHGSSGGMG